MKSRSLEMHYHIDLVKNQDKMICNSKWGSFLDKQLFNQIFLDQTDLNR